MRLQVQTSLEKPDLDRLLVLCEKRETGVRELVRSIILERLNREVPLASKKVAADKGDKKQKS